MKGREEVRKEGRKMKGGVEGRQEGRKKGGEGRKKGGKEDLEGGLKERRRKDGQMKGYMDEYIALIFSLLPADVVFATASGSQNEMLQQSLRCLGGAIAYFCRRPSMETKNSKLCLG